MGYTAKEFNLRMRSETTFSCVEIWDYDIPTGNTISDILHILDQY
jgi:hypothetical protein